MLFAGFNVYQASSHAASAIIIAGVARRRDRRLRSPTRSASSAGVELLERHGAKLHVEPAGLERGAPLVRALRHPVDLRSRAGCRSSVPPSRTPPASRGCRSCASCRWRRSARSSGSAACAARRRGRPPVADVAPPPRLRRLRGRRDSGRGHRLADRALAFAARARMTPPPVTDVAPRLTPSPLLTRARAGRAPRAGGADADLVLRAHDVDPLAARLGLRRSRPRAAQGVRGRASRRHRGRAADRAA